MAMAGGVKTPRPPMARSARIGLHHTINGCLHMFASVVRPGTFGWQGSSRGVVPLRRTSNEPIENDEKRPISLFALCRHLKSFALGAPEELPKMRYVSGHSGGSHE
jgi:hypothetical protein